jgi:ATP-dependent Lon protease
VQPVRVGEALGPPRFFREMVNRTGVPGVATGLAWTPAGGEILFIEATGMPGKGQLTLTGLLGESMRESAQAAMSYLRSHCKELGLEPDQFKKTDVHIHVPAGAVPKDGPSAGVAISAALVSLFRGTPVRTDLAMTGEVTLTGRVLPVGGVREKVLAARRAGVSTVLLPRHNEKDLIELPAEVKADLTFVPIDTLDEAVTHLFVRPETRSATKPKPTASTRPRGAAKRPRSEPPAPKPPPRIRPAVDDDEAPPPPRRRPRPV